MSNKSFCSTCPGILIVPAPPTPGVNTYLLSFLFAIINYPKTIAYAIASSSEVTLVNGAEVVTPKAIPKNV